MDSTTSPAAQGPYRKRCLVPYPTLEELRPVVRDKLQILPFRRNILYTIAQSHGLPPHLLRLIGACFGSSQRKPPTLDWQLIGLRTATVLRAKYEWDVNLPVAEVHEMPQEKIDKIDNISCPAGDILDNAKGPWTDRDRELLRLVGEQLATYSNEAQTVADAVQTLGPDLVVECLVVICLYALLEVD